MKGVDEMNIEQATDRVEILTDLAMSGPDGLQRVVDSIGPVTILSSERAEIMWGIAVKVLPKQWEFEVANTVTGECSLIVTRTS